MAATNSVRTFAAIVYNEVLLNTKRVFPYVLMVLFAANAFLWWFRGPAVKLGWATNSEFYIVRSLLAFSFLTGLPIFNAVIMGDAVIRDFRSGIDPLLFSKPISRGQYLFGKFTGNFIVLVCCQMVFILTLIVLQLFRTSQMVVQPFRVWLYFKHFFFFLVITHLLLAAFYYSVGTLTRNAKIVYGLAIGSYPLYIAYQIFLLKGLPQDWTIILDPFLINTSLKGNGFLHSAEFLNQFVVVYTSTMLSNRGLMIVGVVLCLAITYFKFATHERALAKESFSTLEPSSAVRFEQVRKFAAIVYTEVLLNSKRIAPYAMALVCAGNGLLWWGWGPAQGRGLAVNSDAFIAGALPVYSFMTLPLFTALFMADPVNRDFRAGVDPLIFSKPISRATYLLGKFFGNFFVLVCCQSAFVLTWFVLQGVHKAGVVTQDFKIVPYIKHFLVLVVISHLLLAAFYFAVGALTRNAKIVYGLGVSFYPVYIAYQYLFLNTLPWPWKRALDPLVMRGQGVHTVNAEWLNQLVIVYETDLIVNRAVMILLAAICLTILYARFAMAEHSGPSEEFSVLNLSTAAERVYYQRSPATLLDEFQRSDYKLGTRLAIPEARRVNEGIRANLNKLIDALGVEFRLLRAERGLVVVIPLVIFLSILEVAFYNIPLDVSYSAAYATNTANSLLLFLIGIAVFYTGEAIHRDREVRIEPVIWSTPAPNSVLLLSKCLATVVLTLSLMVVVGLLAMVIQLVSGHTPVDVSAYLTVYGLVLVPNIIFLSALVVALNVLLRNKYLTYVIAVSTGAGLFYLYNIGYNHWLYNPLLYNLWKYTDLTSTNILAYRLYCLALALTCLALAHIFFERKSR